MKKSQKLPNEIKPSVKKNPWGEWVDKLLRESQDRCGCSEMSYPEFLTHCVFFMTITFDRNQLRDRKQQYGLSDKDLSIEWDDFNQIYGAIAQKLFGKKWRKFERQLPLAIACLDFEGSKYSTQLDGNLKNCHLHVIWAVHPSQVSKFWSYLSTARFKLRDLDKLHVDKCETERFDPQKSTISGLGSYALKAMARTSIYPINADMIRIYPNTNYSGVPYRAARIYKSLGRMLEKLRAAIRKR